MPEVFVDTKVGDGNFDPNQIQNYLLLRDNYDEFFKNPPVREKPTIEFLYLPNGKKPAKEAAEDAMRKMMEKKSIAPAIKREEIIIKYLDETGEIKTIKP
jgi:uncharacterized protein YneF (UPF0154 family)